jgi:hypothetical protein
MFTTLRKPVVPILSILLLAHLFTTAQQAFSPTGFSHNDYWRSRPVFDALSNGFTHIEADVYLRGDRLVVCHLPPLFNRRNTLERLYLEPIFNYIEERKELPQTAMDTLVLMIDIKSASDKTVRALQKILEPYRSILSSSRDNVVKKGNLTIVLTGRIPSGIPYDSAGQFFFMDDNLEKIDSNTRSNHLYPLASCRYSRILKWRGRGLLPLKERLKLTALVAKAHREGRKVRLWAAPEKQTVWQELVNCGVDLINTDRLPAVRDFLDEAIQTAALATQRQ